MKYMLILSLLFVGLHAKVFYSKVEPIEKFIVSSSRSGIVTSVNVALEGTVLDDSVIVKVDDYLEKRELLHLNKKIKLLNKNIELNQDLKKNYIDTIFIKNENYNNIKNLTIKSKVEKDRDYFDLMSSKNQLINIKQSILNLEIQLSDAQLKRDTIQKTIKEKNLAFEGKYLYKILVKEGEMLTPAKPIAELYDTRKSRLTFFLSAQEKKEVTNKLIYIDGVKTDYTINKIWSIADAVHLSSYRAEIIVDDLKEFSQLVKIEFKNE